MVMEHSTRIIFLAATSDLRAPRIKKSLERWRAHLRREFHLLPGAF